MHRPNVGANVPLVRQRHTPLWIQQEWFNRRALESVFNAVSARAGTLAPTSSQRGKGSGIEASAYPMTAMAAAFSRNSTGTILSSVSAAVWW
jgi:hypothetical protein